MQIDKQQIIDLLKSQGEDEQAAKAETELPDQVDTEHHRETLSKLGINVADLAKDAGEDLDHPIGL